MKAGIRLLPGKRVRLGAESGEEGKQGEVTDTRGQCGRERRGRGLVVSRREKGKRASGLARAAGESGRAGVGLGRARGEGEAGLRLVSRGFSPFFFFSFYFLFQIFSKENF